MAIALHEGCSRGQAQDAMYGRYVRVVTPCKAGWRCTGCSMVLDAKTPLREPVRIDVERPQPRK